MRPSQLLAINGNHLTFAYLKHRLHPGQKALPKLFRVDAGKGAPKGVMRWNAIFQVEKSA